MLWDLCYIFHEQAKQNDSFSHVLHISTEDETA